MSMNNKQMSVLHDYMVQVAFYTYVTGEGATSQAWKASEKLFRELYKAEDVSPEKCERKIDGIVHEAHNKYLQSLHRR